MNQKNTEKVLMFLESVSRSACLDQVSGDKCRCFSCDAKNLIEQIEGGK